MGIISELGTIINNINVIIPIEMKRALLSSYNYNCVKEICAIAACINKIEKNKVSSLFVYENLEDIIKIWDVSNGEFLFKTDSTSIVTYLSIEIILHSHSPEFSLKQYIESFTFFRMTFFK